MARANRPQTICAASLEKAREPHEAEVAKRMLQINDQQIEGLRKEMSDAHLALWGSRIAYEVTIDPGPPIRYQVKMSTEPSIQDRSADSSAGGA